MVDQGIDGGLHGGHTDTRAVPDRERGPFPIDQSVRQTKAGRAPKHQPQSLDAAEQLRSFDIEGVGEPADRVESEVLLAALDAAEVIAVHSGEVGALLLGEASILP